jgi:SAM-dependent methyltransferase/tetratricopeptide (TPR) repeat protein
MNRKQRRASERRGGSASFAANASAPAEATLTQLFVAAMAQHRAGAIAEAESRYRHILARFPDHAETHGMLGVALATQGRIDEAIPHFERTATLKPGVPGAYDDLGKAYLAAGKPELAVEAAGHALELEETERRKAFLVHCAKSVSFTAENARVRKLLQRALLEDWARPRELTRACLSLIMLDDTVRDAVAHAQRAWPRRLPEAELFGAPGMAVLARDALLCRLLETDPITDLGLERLLTNIRLAILTRAGSSDDGGLLDFYSSIARQCFINEYVFSLDESEAQQAQHLRASLEQASAANGECPPHWLAIAGAYFPLHTLPNAQALLERNWPNSIEALLLQQVKEPAEERAIAPTIAALTGIDDDVSRAVRQHYEESPYPRWSSAGPTGPPQPLNERAPERSEDVLIAGCGTGLSTTIFARNMHQARILAIDLSLASLCYARRMAQKFALTNVEFAQADIMQLGALGRQFDFIDASGVLHHLADPWEGWRVLLSLLREGGTMQISLYSELARRNVVAGRGLIAERGYRPIAHDIRLCREEIAAAEDGSKDGLMLKSLTRSDDFFSMSECRDFLFHPQEHRLTLPQIKAFLAANNLQFSGFALPPAALQLFARRFPDRNAMADLDRWHAFETEAPDTFAAMYQFSVRKP